MSIQSHRDLIGWQKSVELAVSLYPLTDRFPAAEKFGLVTQLRRAGVSVPSNIAEGFGRGKTDDYLRFLRLARGSLFEIDTQLLIAHRLGYLAEQEYREKLEQVQECGRVLAGLIKGIENS